MKKLSVFDLDGTLAESKSALDGEIAGQLGKLMKRVVETVIACLGKNEPLSDALVKAS